MTNIKDDYQAWIDKATDDEQSAAILLREGGIPSTICFLAQQMAEKLLKGFLVFHAVEFEKIHDLLELETAILKIEPAIEGIHSDLQGLNRYYISTRYPGDYPTFSLREAKEAYEAALRVKKFVTDIVPPKEESYEQI